MGLFGGNKPQKAKNRPNRILPLPKRRGISGCFEDMELDHGIEDITRNSHFGSSGHGSSESSSFGSDSGSSDSDSGCSGD